MLRTTSEAPTVRDVFSLIFVSAVEINLGADTPSYLGYHGLKKGAWWGPGFSTVN